MNVVLWVVQGLLALVYLAAGSLKTFAPMATLAKRMEWVATTPPALVRFIGVAELLGGVGLILPLATGVLPWLTPAAAAGLVIVQLGAGGLHASRKEYAQLPANALLLILAAFVLFGRVALLPA